MTDTNCSSEINIDTADNDICSLVRSAKYGFVTDLDNLYAYKFTLQDKTYGLTCLNEIDLLSRIKHPHIMRYINIMTKNNSSIDGLAIILPLADRTLFDIIKCPSITTSNKLPMFYKLASALEFLHSNNILHLDIKADNVLLQDNNPYFVGFEDSVTVDNINKGKYIDSIIGTIDHRAPELLSGSSVYNAAVDVWAFGIMMLYIIGGQGIYPVDFSTISEERLASTVVNLFSQSKYLDKFLINVCDKYKSACKDLLMNILVVNPSNRYTARQILQHKIFDEFRTPISGTLVETGMFPKITSDHRDIVKLIVYWAKSIYPNESSEVLFLAVDLFNRVSIHYHEDEATVRMKMAAACIWVAAKMVTRKVLKLSTYVNIISKTVVMSEDDILDKELELVHNLAGVLNYSKLYNSCKTSEGLNLSLYNIILAKDQIIYSELDIPKWIEYIKTLPGDNPKEITIKEIAE